MCEVLKTWLLNRLGVMIDLSPDVFGHFSKDGTLLAKILHSYDIISDSQLQTLMPTEDPALCRLNLKYLKVWLHFINVDCDYECIHSISKGRGTAALQLFYKVYLSLENKDKLHFITLQKEREKFIPASKKFQVSVVPEEDLKQRSLDSSEESLGKWNFPGETKFRKLMADSKLDREKCRKMLESRQSLSSLEESKNCDSNDDIKDGASVRKNEKVSEEAREEPKMQKAIDLIRINMESASTPEELTRKRKKQAKATREFKSEIQTKLLTEIWGKMQEDQEKEINAEIGKKVLRQSQYEKRMMRKLYEIHEERRRICKNRKIIEDLTREAREKQSRSEERRTAEHDREEIANIGFEWKRMQELYQRLHASEIRKVLVKECMQISDDIVNIAMKVAESRQGQLAGEILFSTGDQWVQTLFFGKP